MKLKTDKHSLQNALKYATRAIGKSIHPVLTNVKLEASTGLKITATDQSITLSTVIDCEVLEAGSLAVPAKKLLELTNSLNGGDLTLQKVENRLQITQGRGKFFIAGCGVDLFPEEPKQEFSSSFYAESNDIKTALRKVYFAVAKDVARSNFSGLFFKVVDKKLTTVGTDGQQLALFTMEIEAPDCEILMPIKTVDLISSLTGELEISINDRWIQVKTETETILSKLVNERFPDYTQVIPENNESSIIVNVDALQSALAKVAVVTNSTSSLIRIKISDKIELEGKDYELGTQGTEQIECRVDGEAIELGLSGSRLLDSLGNIDSEKVKITYKTKTSALQLIEDDNYQIILMPLRLSGVSYD